jgi:hypothetical protein
MMLSKTSLLFLLLVSLQFVSFAQPVFKNPGIPSEETYEITDYIEVINGFVTSKITISLKENNGKKYYYLFVNEGNIYSNEIELNYSDLTTITEKRIDIKSNKLIESFTNNGNNTVHFYNKEKSIDKKFNTKETNIYSRYALFFSLSGFPFDKEKKVTFKTYMFEYGDALTMKVTNIGKQKVTVKAGTYECYKLELSIAGWQSVFASDKYYLYFAVANPHHFVKYEEKKSDGSWNANELVRITKMQK